MLPEKAAQALFAWFLNNAERQERFAAGANLFWFDEGIWPEMIWDAAERIENKKDECLSRRLVVHN